jgi:hypothetical protein
LPLPATGPAKAWSRKENAVVSRAVGTRLAVAFLVVASILVAPTPALAQARAAVVASARVVDATPAWAAHAVVEAELGRLAGRGAAGKMPEWPVRVTDLGSPGSSGSVFGPSVIAGRLPVADVVVARVAGAASLSSVSVGVGGTAPAAVIYVAHVAN